MNRRKRIPGNPAGDAIPSYPVVLSHPVSVIPIGSAEVDKGEPYGVEEKPCHRLSEHGVVLRHGCIAILLNAYTELL